MGHKKLVNEQTSHTYPDFLKKRIVPQSSSDNVPIVIKMDHDEAPSELKKLIESHPSAEIEDNYAEQFAELVLSKNAHLYRANYEVQVASVKEFLEEHYGDIPSWQLGAWAYYPWKNQLIHVLPQTEFETLRTIRNRDLITATEQKKLFKFSAVCFGMSVGSAGALALAISGISRKIKLVDGAVISGSNLNRILTGISSVGQSKATVIGRQIYEMNPYSSIDYFDKVDASNITAIFDEKWSPDVAVDEIDDIEMKIKIRLEARKRRIPVVMATELGDTFMLDVERFDLEPKRPILHGIIPNIEEIVNSKLTSQREWMKYAVRIIDPHNMPIKMQQSLLKIGSTIVTHPQLGSTVMITGGVLAFAVKSIALGHDLRSGRYIISLEKELLADHKTRAYKKNHKEHTRIIKSAIDSM